MPFCFFSVGDPFKGVTLGRPDQCKDRTKCMLATGGCFAVALIVGTLALVILQRGTFCVSEAAYTSGWHALSKAGSAMVCFGLSIVGGLSAIALTRLGRDHFRHMPEEGERTRGHVLGGRENVRRLITNPQPTRRR